MSSRNPKLSLGKRKHRIGVSNFTPSRQKHTPELADEKRCLELSLSVATNSLKTEDSKDLFFC